MTSSFYFYDLETSGLSPRADRIMQFAGIRTDPDFNPIGDPTNLLVTLPDDTLPSPSAIMVTGITPSSTRLDGISEREFCDFFMASVATPGTTIMGYNSVRFDDEFIRHTLWRNFYDPYEWQWRDDRSRWDLLDVVRLTRALRPEGIEWPVRDDGKPTNRLELITKCNHISHEHAHDALSDVEALISVTKLIKEHQPQLFDYLYNLRNKRAVAELVSLNSPKPFVYASGRYPSSTNHTTVAYPIAPLENGCVLVFDLRYNLDELLEQEAASTSDPSFTSGSSSTQPSPNPSAPWEHGFNPIVKKLQYNRCPAVAPLGVLNKENGWQKLNLTEDIIKTNLKSLLAHPEFVTRMLDLAKSRSERFNDMPREDAECALYDGFLDDSDRRLCEVVRNNDASKLADFHPPFTDPRLPELLLHYKAKNYPTSLTDREHSEWEAYRRARLERQSASFLPDLQKIQASLAKGVPFGFRSLSECEYLAEDLYLWYQSLQDAE